MFFSLPETTICVASVPPGGLAASADAAQAPGPPSSNPLRSSPPPSYRSARRGHRRIDLYSVTCSAVPEPVVVPAAPAADAADGGAAFTGIATTNVPTTLCQR